MKMYVRKRVSVSPRMEWGENASRRRRDSPRPLGPSLYRDLSQAEAFFIFIAFDIIGTVT